MHFGSQITAPNGWRDYSKAERYYFCGTHQDQVLIVSFYVYKESWRVSVKHESREAFENALTGSPKKLIINEKQCA